MKYFTLSQSFKVILDGRKFSGPSPRPNSTEIKAYGQAWIMGRPGLWLQEDWTALLFCRQASR